MHIRLSVREIIEMSIKNKILNAITSHPLLVTLGIGLAITFVVGVTVGLMELSQAHAMKIKF
jgi:hypothetical protein